MNKSNADHLRELINSDSYSKEEALEFVIAMEEELRNTEEALKDEEAEKELLKNEIDNTPRTDKVFLGLDTLHYRLENGNMKISDQLDAWITQIKQENSTTVIY